jgi:putative ABC transport system permease protein
METLLNDLRHGLRLLRRQPGFTAVAVLTLALGVGGATALFSLVYGVLLRSFPFPEPDRIVSVAETPPDSKRPSSTVSPRNLEDWAARSRTVERFAAWRDWGFTLRGPDGPEGAPSGIAMPALFEVFGLRPALGRLLSPEDDRPGQNHVVVLSHAYWTGRFGADRRIVGQTLILDDEPYTVVGVLPPHFSIPSLDWIGIWAPVSIDPDQAEGRWLRNRRVYARLRPGTALEAARREMQDIAAQLAAEHPETNAGWGVALGSLAEEEVGAARPALLAFSAAVGLLLLIACVNVANLLLARAAGRERELAVRAALGATAWRTVRLALIESLLLALLGGAAGMVLAMWGVELFLALGPSLPRGSEVRVDGTALGFALLLSAATGVLFGLAPALRPLRLEVAAVLHQGTRSTGSSVWRGLRGRLVVAEMALALVLLVSAGLLAKSFVRLLGVEPGFEPRGLLTVQLFVPTAKYQQPRQVAALYDRVIEQVRGLPGVQAVGAASAGPLFGGRETEQLVQEGRAAEAREALEARWYDIGPGTFEALGVPLAAGRGFTPRDDAGSTRVAIVNESLAQRLWPDRSPIGERVRLLHAEAVLEVVGVVRDSIKALRPDLGMEPEIYWPYAQAPRWAIYLLIRTEAEPKSLVPALRRRLQSVEADLLASNVSTLEQMMARSLRRPRFNALILGLFAATALLLAAVGLYGLLSYSVGQRTREIGVRMAFGAGRRQIFRLILSEALLACLAGAALGLVGAALGTRLLSGLLFGVPPTDAATFAAAALLLAGIALAAAAVPAWRATRIDPLEAIRCE